MEKVEVLNRKQTSCLPTDKKPQRRKRRNQTSCPGNLGNIKGILGKWQQWTQLILLVFEGKQLISDLSWPLGQNLFLSPIKCIHSFSKKEKKHHLPSPMQYLKCAKLYMHGNCNLLPNHT